MRWRSCNNRKRGHKRPGLWLRLGDRLAFASPINAHRQARRAWRERCGEIIPELELAP